MPSRVQAKMAPVPRRRKIGQRRRLEDEAEDDAMDLLDDDSGSDATLASDDNLHAAESDTSNAEESIDTAAAGPSSDKMPVANGGLKHPKRSKQLSPPTPAGTTESNPRIQSKSDYDDNADDEDESGTSEAPKMLDSLDPRESHIASPSSPVIVSSSLASKPQNPPDAALRHHEQEEYRKKRDADPTFVPNRGAFFMHDYRSAAPASNGFRPYHRGRGGRSGRGGIGGPYAPMNHLHAPSDPLISSQWSHDMHDPLDSPSPRVNRRPSEIPQPSFAGDIPKCEESKEPINRHMSTERTLGNTSIRLFLPGMQEPKVMPPVLLKQYTMLPDHRPPLRRDKPARIFLQGMDIAKHIFPATDRSFIFIPRAMRPNQQRGRGKGRSGLGSIGGFSRRTSVYGGGSIYGGSMYGGSMYGGSIYSPSVAMSRRSSIAPAPDLARDLISPAGSTISRPIEPARPVPVVRLPQARPDHLPQGPEIPPANPTVTASINSLVHDQLGYPQPSGQEASIATLPPPQMHPLPDKPAFENRQGSIPMHQPTPKRGVSVESIESPTLTQQTNYQQQAFYHQVPPVQLPHTYHSRQPSFPQISTGTPLSQIPEKAIHAAPFQPGFAQSGYYAPPGPPMSAPHLPQPLPHSQSQTQAPGGYYYPSGPQGYSGPPPTGHFMPGGQPGPIPGYSMEIPLQNTEPNTQTVPGSNTVGTNVGGTVFYSDASQFPPPMAPYTSYQAPYYPPPNGPPANMGATSQMGSGSEGYFYSGPPQGTMYYQQ